MTRKPANKEAPAKRRGSEDTMNKQPDADYMAEFIEAARQERERVDWDKWARMPLWTQKELANMAVGLAPDAGALMPFVTEIHQASEIIARAVHAGVIPCLHHPHAGIGERMYGGALRFKPAEVVGWAAEHFEKFPAEVVGKLSPTTRKESRQERENILAMLGAALELAGFDLRPDHLQPNTIAGKFLDRSAGRCKLGKETAAKRIKEAADLIRPKGPDSN